MWVDCFMSDRLVEITIAGEVGEAIATNTGLLQGSLVSLILFLIYIADLVSLVETESLVLLDCPSSMMLPGS
jgi:hypothetical protein